MVSRKEGDLGGLYNIISILIGIANRYYYKGIANCVSLYCKDVY